MSDTVSAQRHIVLFKLDKGMKKKNEEGLFRQTRQKILLIMKLTTAFLLMSFLSVSAETIAQRTTIKVSNASLKSVFK